MNQAHQNLIRQADAALHYLDLAEREITEARARILKARTELRWETCDFGSMAGAGVLERCIQANHACIRLDMGLGQAYLVTNPEPV